MFELILVCQLMLPTSPGDALIAARCTGKLQAMPPVIEQRQVEIITIRPTFEFDYVGPTTKADGGEA